jgi:hypothetical protein
VEFTNQTNIDDSGVRQAKQRGRGPRTTSALFLPTAQPRAPRAPAPNPTTDVAATADADASATKPHSRTSSAADEQRRPSDDADEPAGSTGLPTASSDAARDPAARDAYGRVSASAYGAPRWRLGRRKILWRKGNDVLAILFR